MLEDAIIPEEEQTDDIDIVEELPVDIGVNAIEEPIIEDNENYAINMEEEPADILLEEGPAESNELTGVADNEQQVSENESSEDYNESDPQANEEEILLNLEKIAISAEITQANVKTGIENLQVLSTCSIGLNALLFGGFVIFCYLNRLG